jgi:hypothetical protein
MTQSHRDFAFWLNNQGFYRNSIHSPYNLSRFDGRSSQMYLVKNNKSPFYQIVYFVNGKRTTHSTKKTNEQSANQYLKEFIKTISISSSPTNSQPQAALQIIDDKNKVTLSKFKEEYLTYCRPIKSSKYVISTNLSFKQFISVVGDLCLYEITSRNVDQFITTTFACTQRGSHHYYRTLKAAFNKAIEWDYISTNPFIK